MPISEPTGPFFFRGVVWSLMEAYPLTNYYNGLKIINIVVSYS